MEGIVKFNDVFSYKIVEDGYYIYSTDGIKISQRGLYAHPFKTDGTYEENAILQIENIIKTREDSKKDTSILEVNQANIDYLALMLDVELPNQEEEPVTEEEGE